MKAKKLGSMGTNNYPASYVGQQSKWLSDISKNDF